MKISTQFVIYLLFIATLNTNAFASGKLDVLQWIESPTDLNGDGIINALDVFIAAKQFNTGENIIPQPTPTPDPRLANLPNVGEVQEIAVQNGSVITLDFPTGNEAYLVLVRNESFTQSSIVAIEDNSQITNPLGFYPKIDSSNVHTQKNGCCVIPEIITYPERFQYTPLQFQQLNVGQKKTFKVYQSADVNATLRYLGTHAAIYVDDTIWMQGDTAVDQELVDREGGIFDETTFDAISSAFGMPGDVNNDGHIGILITPSASIQDGAGFFFGGDLFRRNELDPAFPTNTMELLYIAPPNTPGANVDEDDLTPIIAHELQHLINFYYHSLIFGGRNGLNDEERWMDEGMSHLAEDFVVSGRSNRNRRNLFLADTDVQGVFVDNVFPGSAQRGGGYLFCRYLVDRFGEGIIPKLVKTAKMGFSNIESAAGMNIKDIHRDWSRALFVSNLGISTDPVLNYRFFAEHSNAGGRDWGRPKFVDLDLSNLQFFGALYYSSIVPGGFGYAVLRSSMSGTHEIKVTLDDGVLPAVDIIRLPDQFVFYDYIAADAWVSSERDSVILDEPLQDVFVVGESRTIKGYSADGKPLTRMRAFFSRGSGVFRTQKLFEAQVDGDRFAVNVLFENAGDAGSWNIGFLPNANTTTSIKPVQVVLP